MVDQKIIEKDVMRGAVASWLKNLEWQFLGFVRNRLHSVMVSCIPHRRLHSCSTVNQDQVEVIRASQPIRRPGIVRWHHIGAFG